MSIKQKIILSCIVMLVVPAVLILILTALLLAVFFLLHPTVELSLYEGLEISNPAVLKLIIIWAIMAVLVVITTCICVTSYLTQSILHPLKEMNQALEHLKRGELDYEFTGSEDLELRELCTSLEALRLRLQESISGELAREQDQKMLLANISHDIKTPITSIQGYVEGILDGVANTPDMQQRYLCTIRSKAKAIQDMVENLSLYSKLELKRVLYHMERTDIFAFLTQVTDEFVLDLQNNHMALECHIASTPAPVKMDREKLRRVFSNLITNAIKYKKEDTGSLSITGEATEHGALITFSDSGKGIDSKDLARVFEGFYRGDPSRNNRIEGNGLGLSISRQIVQDHGGKIWIRSELNKGTDVMILFPLLPTNNQRSEEQ